jgi:hypothetical protein
MDRQCHVALTFRARSFAALRMTVSYDVAEFYATRRSISIALKRAWARYFFTVTSTVLLAVTVICWALGSSLEPGYVGVVEIV